MGVRRGPGSHEVAERLRSSGNQCFSVGLWAAPFHVQWVGLCPGCSWGCPDPCPLLHGEPQAIATAPATPRVPRAGPVTSTRTRVHAWLAWPREQACLRSLPAKPSADRVSPPGCMQHPLYPGIYVHITCTSRVVLSASPMPGAVLGVGDTAVTKREGTPSSPAA